jgi:hypothetical protein
VLIAVDLDDTIDAFPQEMRTICTSLVSCGHTVWVVTGTEDSDPTEADVLQKQFLLTAIGFTRGAQYDNICVLPPPHPENKAAWLAANSADILIDNDKANAAAAADICLVLLPWQTRTPQKPGQHQ